jgi:hypothetical protein
VRPQAAAFQKDRKAPAVRLDGCANYWTAQAAFGTIVLISSLVESCTSQQRHKRWSGM